MQKYLVVGAIILASGCTATAASQFRAVNSLWVQPTGPRTFSISFQSTNDNAYWCAAGDYVQRRLGLPGRTPIFRMSEPPRRSGQGLAFSLDPDGAASRTGVSVFGNSGPANSVSATIARNLCPTFPIFGDF